MQKRILLVGDSLGLPRDEIDYGKTWPFLLSQSFTQHHFVFKFQRALSSKNINSGMFKDYLEFYNPDVVIMQLGIVDCAPRFLKKTSIKYRLLNSLPKSFSESIWKLIKKRGKRIPQNADVPLRCFEIYLRKYIERCLIIDVKNVFFIKIANASTKMMQNNPEVVGQIKLYNSVIDSLAREFDFCRVISTLENADDKFFISDGYHLNEYGSSRLLKELIQNVKDA